MWCYRAERRLIMLTLLYSKPFDRCLLTVASQNAMTGIDICRMMKRRLKGAGLPGHFSPRNAPDDIPHPLIFAFHIRIAAGTQRYSVGIETPRFRATSPGGMPPA